MGIYGLTYIEGRLGGVFPKCIYNGGRLPKLLSQVHPSLSLPVPVPSSLSLNYLVCHQGEVEEAQDLMELQTLVKTPSLYPMPED